MSLSLTEDVKSLAEFERDPLKIVQQVHDTGRPVVVMAKGKADVVVVDALTFEQRLRAVNLAHLLAEGEADVRAERTRPASEFFSELRREKKVSR
jgi:PHD/YefM family antitoxin component YafN of YafNO toxin-antitoxin module